MRALKPETLTGCDGQGHNGFKLSRVRWSTVVTERTAKQQLAMKFLTDQLPTARYSHVITMACNGNQILTLENQLGQQLSTHSAVVSWIVLLLVTQKAWVQSPVAGNLAECSAHAQHVTVCACCNRYLETAR